MRMFVTVLFLITFGGLGSAFAQPVPSTQAIAQAPQLEAGAITTACAALPPADSAARELTPMERVNYRWLLVHANSEQQQGRDHLAQALANNWGAYLLSPSPEIVERMVIILDLMGATADAYSCALVTCLAPRTPTGSVRSRLEIEQTHCAAVSRPTVSDPPVTVARIALTGEALQAVQADSVLVGEIRRDHAADTTAATTWQVPSTYQSRIEAALARFRMSRVTTRPTPVAQRSMPGYVVPIALWAAGTATLVTAVVSTITWSDGNEQLAAANAGQTRGWPRQIETDTQNAAVRAEVLFPVAAALVGGGVAAWFGLAPHHVTVVPTVAPHALSVSASIRF